MPDNTPATTETDLIGKTPQQLADDLKKIGKFKQAVAKAERSHEAIKELANKGAAYARDAGNALLDAQERYKWTHDGTTPWTKWADENIKIPRSTREFYMFIARNYDTVVTGGDISQNAFRQLMAELKKAKKPNALENVNPTTTPSGTSQPAATTAEAVAEPVAPAPTKNPNQPVTPPAITVAGIMEALDATTKALAARPVTEIATTAIARQLEQISGSLTTLRDQIRFEMDRQAEGTKQPAPGPWIQSADANLVNPPQVPPARTDAPVVTGG